MQTTGISFSHTTPQSSEPLPVRLKTLQRLGRLFRIGSGKNGKGSPSVSKTDLLNLSEEKRLLSPPTSPGFGDATLPKTSHETDRPSQSKGHGNRTLHHSISTPTIGRLTKQNAAQRRISGEADSGNAKPAVPVVISLLRDLQPSYSQSKKSQPLSTITSVSLDAPGSQDDLSSRPPASQLQRRSTDQNRSGSPPPLPPSRTNLTIDRTPELNGPASKLKRRFSTSPKQPSRQESFESSSASPASSAFYPAYVQEKHLTSMTSLNSGVTSATTLDEADVQPVTEERTGLTRKKSVSSKVCRVLGSCPPDVGCGASSARAGNTDLSEFGELLPPGSPSPSHRALQSRSGSPENSTGSFKGSRRMSLTLSTLTSIPARLRPPLHIRRPSASTLASSSPTSPVNNNNPFDGAGKIAGYISEESNELRDDAYATGSTHSLVSPIAFNPNPPSPVSTRPHGRLYTNADVSPTTSTNPPRKNLSFAWPTPSSSSRAEFGLDSPATTSGPDSASRVQTGSALLPRPRSLSHASPTFTSSPWSARFFSSKGGPDTGSNAPSPSPRPLSPGHDEDDMRNHELPVRAGWLESPVGFSFASGTAKPEREPDHVTVTGKTSVAEWSGRWNEEDMQQVINKLRKLR